MSYPDEDWFQYNNDFNQLEESPGGNGAPNFESGNVDNIPLNDDDPEGVEFDLVGPMDEFQMSFQETKAIGETRVSRNDDIVLQEMSNALNRLREDTNANQSEIRKLENQILQLLNKNLMTQAEPDAAGISTEPTPPPPPPPQAQNTPANTSFPDEDWFIYTNDFDQRTESPGGNGASNFESRNIDSQQSPTPQGNDMLLTDNHDMVGQQTAHLAQGDHVNPPTAGNSSSNSGMNQQNNNGVLVQPRKSKIKKITSAKNKPTTSAGDTVGSVLQKAANRNSLRVKNDNDNQEIKPIAETRVSLNDTMVVIELNNALNRLRRDPNADQSEMQNLESEILRLLTKNMVTQGDNQVVSQTPPPPRPPSKARIAAAKIVMEPPKTTMDTSNKHMQNVYEGVKESYTGQPRMDKQETKKIKELVDALDRLKIDTTADQAEIQSLENQIFKFFSKKLMIQAPPPKKVPSATSQQH
ncbi:unnamed protein product [Caenorhabditis brenneri]